MNPLTLFAYTAAIVANFVLALVLTGTLYKNATSQRTKIAFVVLVFTGPLVLVLLGLGSTFGVLWKALRDGFNATRD